MRPTWHFVAPGDIRWMLALAAPRVSTRMALYNRRLELDAATFRRSEKAMVRALRGGAQLTRQELKAVLQRAGIRVDGTQRLAHVVMQAELDAVIAAAPGVVDTSRTRCSTSEFRYPARRRVMTRWLNWRDAFRSHGPASLRLRLVVRPDHS